LATYEVPEFNLTWLRAKIEKLNKTAEKLDVQPITMKVISERLREVSRTQARDSVEASLIAIEGNAGMMAIKVVTVEVIGEAPVLKGWKFVATLQHIADNGDSSTVIHAVPGETVPVQYRETDGRWCDHCETRRVRNDTFIVQKVSVDILNENDAGYPTGTYRQVGRQCLKDFIGHPKPEMYADWAESLGLLDDMFRGAGADHSGLTKYERLFMTRTYMCVVAEVIKQSGWVSGKMAYEAEERGEHLDRTSNLAATLIMSDAPAWKDFKVTEDSIKLADAALEWAATVLPKRVVEQPNNDYLYNLRQVAKLEGLNYRVLGIAASLIPAYQRDTQKQVTFEDRAAQSQWVGEPGVRFQFIAQVTALRSINYQDGTTGTVIEFTDDEGNELVWFTGGQHGFERGKTYRVKATVKRHSEFRGIKQTAINRAQSMGVVA